MSARDGLRYGVATAAFQIEGATDADGRAESIWDRFCATPGAVANGDDGTVACDHYRRWEDDLDLMASLGIESYRFSIAWPRVVPHGSGSVNQAGLDFYRRLVDGLHARGIEPIATLYHWDLPQRLQDAGGWPARETAQRFAEYAAVVARALGDGVTEWVTQNEPWCSGFLGYAEGRKAPGIRHWPSALAATHHLLLSHGWALQALRAALPGSARAGIALNLSTIHAASDREEDVAAARRQDGYLNRWFLDPVFRGAYPQDMVELFERATQADFDVVRDGDLEAICAPADFLGVNYYNPMRVRDRPGALPLELEHLEPREPVTAMGWEVDASGLADVLRRVAREYTDLPIYVTENGAAYDDGPVTNGTLEDAERTTYLADHVAAVEEAVAAGVPVERYCVWSLLDNFEWEDGYGKRFGIVHVDFETQRRTPKRSALWYRDLIASARG